MMRKVVYTQLIIALCCMFSVGVQAEDPKKKGYEIVAEMDKRGHGFIDSKVHLEMHITNRKGDILVRKMRHFVLEGEKVNKILMIFDNPSPVKGIALLTWVYKSDKENHQMVYFPQTKRVKRIAARGKTGRFMGSTFTFEDFERHEMSKFEYEYKGDEVYSKKDCFVVVFYPKNKRSGYKYRKIWIEKKEYQMLKIDFYDKKSRFSKTLVFDFYRKYLDKFWYSHRMRMKDHRRRTETTLILSDYEFQTGMIDGEFTRNALKRKR